MNTIKAIETRYKGCRFRSRLEARWAIFFDTLGVKWEYEREGYDLGDGVLYLPDFWLPDTGQGCFVEIKPKELDDEEKRKAMLLAEKSNQFVMTFCGNPWPGEVEVTEFRRKQEIHPLVKETLMSLARNQEFRGTQCIDWKKFYVPEFVAELSANSDGYWQNQAKWYEPTWAHKKPLAYCRYHRSFCFGFFMSLSYAMCDGCGQQVPSDCGCNSKPIFHVCFDGHKNQDYDKCDGIVSCGGELDEAFGAARSARFEHGETP